MRGKGFTLVELMIVLSVVGLVLVFTMPSFVGYVKTMNKDQARQKLIESLRLARQEAVTQHRPVIVAFGTGGVTTNITSYTIHVDTNGDHIKQSGEPFYTRTLPSGTKLSKVSLNPPDTVTFDISGTLWPSSTGGSLIVAGSGHPDTLYISIAGMVYKP